jgi:hypothetical protein
MRFMRFIMDGEQRSGEILGLEFLRILHGSAQSFFRQHWRHHGSIEHIGIIPHIGTGVLYPCIAAFCLSPTEQTGIWWRDTCIFGVYIILIGRSH